MTQEHSSKFLLTVSGIQHRVPRRTLSPHRAFQGSVFLAQHYHWVRISFSVRPVSQQLHAAPG